MVIAAISSSSFSAASEILGPSAGAFFSFVRPEVFSENLSVLFCTESERQAHSNHSDLEHHPIAIGELPILGGLDDNSLSNVIG